MKLVAFVLFLAVSGVTLSIGNAQTAAPTKKSSGKSAQSKSGSSKSGPGNSASARTTPARTTSLKSASTKTLATRTGARNVSAASRTSSAKKSVRRVAAGPPRQAAPTPERYKEIQRALADKGYLKSEPNGVWDAQSTDALRQYQTDRKLEPSGKLTAAALIDLGLGPKNELHPAPDTPAAQVPDPPKVEAAPQR